jgi:hypothetical protein
MYLKEHSMICGFNALWPLLNHPEALIEYSWGSFLTKVMVIHHVAKGFSFLSLALLRIQLQW